MKDSEDLINLYLNYLHSIEERKLYGDKYGDTEKLIKMYEEKLNKVLKKVKKK